MDSSTICVAPVVERVEDMSAYAAHPPAMYEVPHVNGQNFNSANYPDWGAASFSESRRRSTRTKPQNSRRNHQQPAWATECGPAPASPAWQPQQSPPVPEAGFKGFQEPSGPVTVNLQGLPTALCKRNFLEAMLDQAGLADDTMGCVLGEDQDAGKAAIYLADYNAAVKCVQHFGGRRWANAGPQVTAEIAEGQGTPAVSTPTAAPATPVRAPGNSRPVGGNRKLRNYKPQEQLILPPAALGYAGAWTMPQPVLPIVAMQDYQKGSGYSPKTAGGDSPKTTGSNGSNSPKTTRWADLADDDKDLSEGFEGSTSAGSSGRTSLELGALTGTLGESFFFGCDVDTDDGF